MMNQMNNMQMGSLTDGRKESKRMEVNDEVQNAVSDALDMAQRGKTREAMAVLTGLLPDHPLHHDIPYGIGVVHAVKGEYEESIK